MGREDERHVLDRSWESASAGASSLVLLAGEPGIGKTRLSSLHAFRVHESGGIVLYGSNLGNADTHVTTNLPTLFAGGGFRHGQHLAFDKSRNYPLPNLFNSMLRRLRR